MKFWPLVWGNLMRRKARTVLTLLSVTTAFVLFGYLCATREALSLGVEVRGADRLIVRHRVSIVQLLPERYRQELLQIPGVLAAVPGTWFGGIYQDPRNFFPQFAVEPDIHLSMFPEFIIPEEQVRAWKANRTAAIVGRNTAERFGWSVGDRIPIQGTIWNKKDGGRTWLFDLAGIYDATEPGADTTQFLFHYDYFDEARAFGQGSVGWFTVRVDDPENAAEVAKRIDAHFRNSQAETKSETERAFTAAFALQLGNITSILAAVQSAVFFTILLVAGNTMDQSVRERREELAVLKALGFTSLKVTALVLLESCALAAIGGGLGLGLSWLAIARGDPTGGLLPMFRFPGEDVLLGVALAFSLGMVAGALPSVEAMRLRVSDALRRN